MKPQILLLHGYLQNGEKIKKSFTKLMGKTYCNNYEIISPDGVYSIDNLENQYGWWNLPFKEIFCQPHKYNIEGFFEYFEKLLKNYQNLKQVYGFSQGAVALTLLISNDVIVVISVLVIGGTKSIPKYFRIKSFKYIIIIIF